jgi:pantetheine-phosphate adenylyltransferase
VFSPINLLGLRIESIFMTTDPKYFVLRSSSIQGIGPFSWKYFGYGAPLAAEALREKYR